MTIDWDTLLDEVVADYIAPKFVNRVNVIDDNPLVGLVPLVGMERCFGTYVQNIFIVKKPYGWIGDTYSWPPAGYDDAKARIIEAYKYFASYETLVWLDKSFDCDECEDTTTYCDKMDQTEEGIIEMCAELAEYGFTYMGQLTTADAAFFEAYIDVHQSGVDPERPILIGAGH